MTLSNEQIKNQLLEHKDVLKGYGVTRLGLFGSYVKDLAHDESDIDFLVELEELTFDSYMNLRIFLEDVFDKKIDLVIAQSLKPQLRPYVLEEVEYVSEL